MNRIRTVVTLLALIALGACAPARRPPVSTLSPDSAALLRRALRLARPAYATQREAVRAGVYRGEPPAAPPPATTAPPVLAAPRRMEPAGEPAARFVIQVGAFRDARAADLAARDARFTFPDMPVAVEWQDGWHRVALGAWSGAAAAEARLEEIRRLFPGAQIRHQGAP